MDFDVIVIGSGIGGMIAAKILSQSGKKVAIVEKKYYGGVVYNVGSTRKKELVTLAKSYFINQQYRKHGVANLLKLDWEQAMEWIDMLEEDEDKNHQMSLKKAGVTTIYGKASFESPNEISVDGIIYSAKQFIITTGAKPRPLSFSGCDFLSDSSDFLTQKEIPKRVIFIGAGIISFAFITIASAFNCEVTVIQHDDKALKNFDQEFVSQLIEINKKRGVTFRFNDEITNIHQEGTQLIVQTKNGQLLETDKVYNVSGRVPLVDDLGLDKAEVTYEPKGIITNDFLQTSQSHIYACGDCSNANVPKLATYSAFQSEYIASLILEKTLSPIHYPIPSMSIFSDPRIAQVGVSTSEALENSDDYQIIEYDLSNWLDSKRKAEDVAMMKTVIRKSDNRLVGATVISHEADVLINYITLGLNMNMTKEELDKQLFAYPSIANELGRFWK